MKILDLISMQKTSFFYILLLTIICTCKSSTHHPDAQKISDTTHDLVVQAASMYDTITPPKLIVDSVKLYQRLGELLEFSSKLKYNENDRIAFYYLIIENDGQIREGNSRSGLRASEDIEADMKPVMDFLLMNINKWEPAYLKKNPSKKITHLIEITFHFYRDRILFAVRGEESYYFLKKSYKPNYLKEN